MRASIFGCCLAALALCSSGCEEYGQRVYTARLYRVGARCLEPYTPIGVVQAGELDVDCAQCLSLDGALYVSRVCPPLPARADPVTPSAEPACALALAAFSADVTCGASDAGVDGGLDAGPDASRLETSAGP
jgi:hypothetical protein